MLGGVINPLANVQPSDLNIAKLLERLKDSEVKEVILALNPNVEGEATTSFLSQLLSQTDIKVTRLASGLPVGGDLEYADEITLGRALAGRRAVCAPLAWPPRAVGPAPSSYSTAVQQRVPHVGRGWT